MRARRHRPRTRTLAAMQGNPGAATDVLGHRRSPWRHRATVALESRKRGARHGRRGAIIRQGPKAWNAWRLEHRGKVDGCVARLVGNERHGSRWSWLVGSGSEGKGAELRAAVTATLEHWPELAWSNALSRSTCRRSRAYPSEPSPTPARASRHFRAAVRAQYGGTRSALACSGRGGTRSGYRWVRRCRRHPRASGSASRPAPPGTGMGSRCGSGHRSAGSGAWPRAACAWG